MEKNKKLSYDEVVERINNARRFGKEPGVLVMEEVCKKLPLGQNKIPCIHVAGTNGKGSVCAFLSNILLEAGYKVGTFISPHLIDFEERIQIDGKMISKELVTHYGNYLLSRDFGVELTMFDYCFSMALLYFTEQNVDCMVIETGLGGRLDSTNILKEPDICVLTKIGFDHMAILGNTIAKIAKEKAGIIKPGSVVISERQDAEASAVILETIQRENSSLYDISTKLYMVTEEDILYTSKTKLGLLGVHQWENAAAARLAARIFLQKYGIKEPFWLENENRDERIEDVIENGLTKTTWPGRMELLSEQPFFMVDGAHNGHGVHALCESLKALYPDEKFIFFMAVMADKDYEQMVEEMLPLAERFYTFTPESTRALQNSRLAEYIIRQGVPASICESIADIRHALDVNKKNVAFGSLYFIGDLKKTYQ